MNGPRPSTAELLATVVHDLKNPLATILGNAEYLARASELSDDSREALDELLESAAAAEQLLTDVAALSAAVAGNLAVQRDEVDVAAVLAEIAAAARARAQRLGVTLAVDGSGSANADRSLLRRLLRALVGLALRRSPEGSQVTVSVQAGPGGIRLRVADDGPGLDEGRLADLFGAKGGVPLLLVKAICDLAGGTVRAQSGARGLAIAVELP